MNSFIVLMTDFSLDWPFVATMKGVCKSVCPTLEVIDGVHTIDKFNVLDASQQLCYVEPYWPKNTVFVCVVDPGVGTSRKGIVAKMKNGHYIVTPDNGTLTHLYYQVGIEEVRQIDDQYVYPGADDVSVFHGRDIFSYVAALLASNKIAFEDIGPLMNLENLILLDKIYLEAQVTNEVIHGIVSNVSDPFGSIVFNIKTADFKRVGYSEKDVVHVVLKKDNEVYFEKDVLYEKAFGFVEVGQPILFNSSSNYISLGINQGSFKDTYQVKTGLNYQVELTKKA